MPFNIPTVSASRISFGPARLFLGPAGATPTVDVGAIGEDGVSVELQSEKLLIMQGNPRTVEHVFSRQQGVKVSVTGIEWNFNNLLYALGGGTTSLAAAAETFVWGGDPSVDLVALQVQHRMAAGHTVDMRVWRAFSENGVTLPMGGDEHKFEYSWVAGRASTNWAGAALSYDEQLIQIVRTIAA